MVINISKQVNPVFECLDILTRYVSDYSYTRLKKEVKTKLDIQVPEVEHLLDFLQNIADRVTASIDKNEEMTNFLFSSLDKPDSTPAQAILQYYEDFSERDLDKMKQGILSDFRRDPLALLYMMLDNYDLLNVSSGKKPLKNNSLLDLMESCSLPDRNKWRILVFYHDFEAYLDKLFAVLGQAVDAFLPFLPSLEPWTAPFYDRFFEEINNDSLYRYMAEKIHLILPETDSIRIQPTLFGCSHLQYLAASQEGRASNMLWGMHFDVIFSSRLKQNSSTYLCNNLKLLGDKSKFDILKLLSVRQYYSGELAKELSLSAGTIAYHMQALLNAQFVNVDKRSYRTYYELNRSAVNDFLEQVRHQLVLE